jgi:signal transduction histidine kinase
VRTDRVLFPWLPLAGLAAVALSASAGRWWDFRTFCSRLRERDRELSAARKELRSLRLALAEARGEVARLKETSGADLLPTLKLAHELRSPLASIQSSLDVLLQGYAEGNPELRDEMVNLARDRAAMMLGRVNDFLRLGSIRRTETERRTQAVQLLDVLKHLTPEMEVRARWRAVELVFDLPPTLSAVSATREDMEHLLSNLINNAVKYTLPGGTVTVKFREEARGIVGAVIDTGIGISKEDLPRIFDEFYRADNARDLDGTGTGLGLVIAKRVVELYGGQLTVASELGKGSIFTFVLPNHTGVAS